MSIADRERLIASLAGAFNRRDIDAVLDLMHPDVELYSALPDPGSKPVRYLGHDGVRHYFSLLDEWAEVSVTISHVRAAGDAVVGLGRVYAQGRRGVLDSPSSWVWRFRDGLIVHSQVFTDLAGAEEAARINH